MNYTVKSKVSFVFAFILTMLSCTAFANEAGKLKSFDVVGALGQPYSVTINNPLIASSDPGLHPFGGVGTRFVATGVIYPGGTFDVHGPFVANDYSLLYPAKIVGKWICNGLITGDAPQVVPGSLVFGSSTLQFQIVNNNGRDSSVFVQDTLRSIDFAQLGTGNVARTQDGVVLGGYNQNENVKGNVVITTYLYADGNGGIQFLNHYEFKHPIDTD